MPTISITGTGLAFGGGQTDNVTTPVQSFEWSEQLSWTHGRHTMRFGYGGQRNLMDICNCGKTRGSLTFQTFSDFLLGMSGAQNGTTLSNVFSSGSTAKLFTQPNHGRENNMNVFAQDDFKVTPQLTFNLGLRWEYAGTGYDDASYGGTNPIWSLFLSTSIPPSTGTYAGFTVKHDFKGTVPDGVIRRSTNLLTYGHAPFTNFAPRLGFAWQPLGTSGKFVVRGGGGMFYKLIDGQHFLNTWDGSPPVAAPFSRSGASNAPATFAVPFVPPIVVGTFDYFLRTPSGALNVLGVDPNLVTPVTYSWNLDTQYALASNLLVELGYVGQRSYRTEAPLVQNIPMLASPGAPVNCGAPSGCITTNTAANAPQRVPVIGMVAGGFSSTANVGQSSYHALQATVRKTLSRGLEFQAAYTWGKCLGNFVGTSTAASGQGGNVSYNRADPKTSKGECGYDRPQRLVVTICTVCPVSRAVKESLAMPCPAGLWPP
jgi:hypothetical protein